MSTGSSPSSRRNSFRSESFSDEKDLELPPEYGCLSIVVLGASGDLAKKKTFPALFNLFRQVSLLQWCPVIIISIPTVYASDSLRY